MLDKIEALICTNELDSVTCIIINTLYTVSHFSENQAK